MRSLSPHRLALALLICGPLLAAGAPPAVRATAGAPASGPPPVLVWHVSQGLWGTLRLEVTRAGVVTYHFKPARRDQPEESAQQTLRPAQMKELYAVMRDAGACWRKGKRKAGIPDEGRPTLVLSWQKLRCTVEMWDGEWFEDPKARAIAHAIRKLIQKTKAASRRP